MTHRFNLFLLILIMVIGLPLYLLLFDDEAAELPAKPLEIAELRRLAAVLPGRAPDAIRYEIVASRGLPQTLLAAGSGFKWVSMPVFAYRVSVPGGAPIVIDTGMSKAQAEESGMTWYNPRAQRRIEQMLDEAGLILATGEHLDHLGGLMATAGRSDILGKAWLNAAQSRAAGLDDPELGDAGRPAGRAPPARIGPDRPRPVAPGVVVVPAPGHGPGSQMIYVRLENGREHLFTGDVAPLAVSWQAGRPRSRLMPDRLPASDRSEVAAWLRTIARLHRQAPDMVIVPGHDARPLATSQRAKPDLARAKHNALAFDQPMR